MTAMIEHTLPIVIEPPTPITDEQITTFTFNLNRWITRLNEPTLMNMDTETRMNFKCRVFNKLFCAINTYLPSILYYRNQFNWFKFAQTVHNKSVEVLHELETTDYKPTNRNLKREIERAKTMVDLYLSNFVTNPYAKYPVTQIITQQDKESCSICWDEASLQTNCGHHVCSTCIKQYAQPTCPYCRQLLSHFSRIE